MDRPALVCLGNLSIDDVVHPDGSLHAGQVGGDALYATLAAKLFQPRTEMVAPVGRDHPAVLAAILRRAGLCTDGLPPRDCDTLANRIEHHGHDSRTFTLLSGEADFETMSPRPADVPACYREASAFLILAMTLAAQQELVPACRAHPGALVALDPQAEYINGQVDPILAMVRHVDVFTPSLDEVALLLGHADPGRAVRQLAALGPRIVVVKMGGEGSWTHDALNGVDIVLPPYPGQPVDTVGGGDAFCGGFLAAMTRSGDLRRAAVCGAVAASFAIASFGVAALEAATPEAAEHRTGFFR